MGQSNLNGGVSRRNFLKYGGLAGTVLGIGGIAGAGYKAGKGYDSYTGWERYHHGAGQFFNRKPFRVDKATYGVEGETRRVIFPEILFSRLVIIGGLLRPKDGSRPKWNPGMGIDALPDEDLKNYYMQNPESLKLLMKFFQAAGKQRASWEKYKFKYALADAWSTANGSPFSVHGHLKEGEALYPEEPKGPPEESDFEDVRKDKLVFKSEEHAAQLIKMICHSFGSTLVGITKLNPDWVYQGKLRGVGRPNFEVPKHWQYAIVTATPHEWDTLYANPTYGTSYDGYSRERWVGGKIQTFIRSLGYPARVHIPPYHYDVVAPPIAVDAGLGEQGTGTEC